jgi:hypothetical protein
MRRSSSRRFTNSGYGWGGCGGRGHGIGHAEAKAMGRDKMPLILVGDQIEREGYFVMAEEWIDHLAKQIIAKDTDAANEIKRREHKEFLIKANAFLRPLLDLLSTLRTNWKNFLDLLLLRVSKIALSPVTTALLSLSDRNFPL